MVCNHPKKQNHLLESECGISVEFFSSSKGSLGSQSVCIFFKVWADWGLLSLGTRCNWQPLEVLKAWPSRRRGERRVFWMGSADVRDPACEVLEKGSVLNWSQSDHAVRNRGSVKWALFRNSGARWQLSGSRTLLECALPIKYFWFSFLFTLIFKTCGLSIKATKLRMNTSVKEL